MNKLNHVLPSLLVLTYTWLPPASDDVLDDNENDNVGDNEDVFDDNDNDNAGNDDVFDDNENDNVGDNDYLANDSSTDSVCSPWQW